MEVVDFIAQRTTGIARELGTGQRNFTEGPASRQTPRAIFLSAHERGLAPRAGNSGGSGANIQELKQLLAIPSANLKPEQLSKIRAPLSFEEAKQLTREEQGKQSLLNQIWNL